MAQVRLRRARFRNIQHRNVFDVALRYSIKTKFVTILAPGKLGVPGYDFLEECIPRKDNTIIAVNFAVVIGHELERPYLEPDIWMVSDTEAIQQVVAPDTLAWFPKALERFQGQRIFNLNVVEICWKELKHGGPYLSFASKHLMKGDDVAPSGYIIRAGGSITSAAVQLDNFFHKHPEPVTLICGADMSGDDYVRGKNEDKQHGNTWPGVHCLGRVIQDRGKRGSNIYTISDTRLLDAGYIEYYPEYLLWCNQRDDVVDTTDTTDAADIVETKETDSLIEILGHGG